MRVITFRFANKSITQHIKDLLCPCQANSVNTLDFNTLSQSKYHQGLEGNVQFKVKNSLSTLRYWGRGHFKASAEKNEWRDLLSVCFNSEECCWITSKVKKNWRTANEMNIYIVASYMLHIWLPACKNLIKRKQTILLLKVVRRAVYERLHCKVILLHSDTGKEIKHGRIEDLTMQQNKTRWSYPRLH